MRIQLAWLALLLLACGEPPTPPAEASFVADEDPGGPALLLDVSVEGNRAHLRVIARDLGPVLGVAAHLRFDPTAVNVHPAGESALHAALDPESDGLVRAFVAPHAGEIWWGATRTSVAAGEVELIGEQVLLELDLDTRDASRSVLAFDDVIVRRADGSFVRAAMVGGLLTLTGAL